MQIRIRGTDDDPYIHSLEAMAEMEFPGAMPKGQATLDAVATELVGTKQHRYGPTPDPESLVAIRKVVRDAMEHDLPVPVFVPWGGSKQSGNILDVADLMAFKQLRCLNRRVKEHYKPGLDLRVRLEVFTESSLYGRATGSSYASSLPVLSNIIDTGAKFSSELDVTDRATFLKQAEENASTIEVILHRPEDLRPKLFKDMLPSWTGTISEEHLGYYMKTYERFYPQQSYSENLAMAARYFGRSLARYQLGATGRGAAWNDYITLAFVTTPFGRTGRRIYYRTIPERYGRTHHAPWIGKGYVKITGRDAAPAIAGATGDGLEYVPSGMVLTRGAETAEVAADYVVVS